MNHLKVPRYAYIKQVLMCLKPIKLQPKMVASFHLVLA